MSRPLKLADYFPVQPQREVRGSHPFEGAQHNGKVALKELPTRWRVVLTMELQGLNKIEISNRLGYGYEAVLRITRDERYVKFRNEYLASLDDQFFAMKPLAMEALRGGLTSSDAAVALRAADQWFGGARFGGYDKREQPSTKLTAEDVVKHLLAVQVNVNVNNSGDK